MERDEALRLLSGQKVEIRRRFGVKSMSLFGSTARDEAGPDSDVDVLVEFEPTATPSLLDFIDLKHFLSDELKMGVDLVDRRTIIPELRNSILSGAIDV